MPLVYVIDDSPTDRSLVVRFLKRHFPMVDVVTVEDGVAALEQFSEIEQDLTQVVPTLILLDQRMPKLNGDEMMVRLRHLSRFIFVPVVLFSSSSLEEDVLACLASGCASYVRKPLEFREFERVVKTIADYWLTVHSANVFPTPPGSPNR